MRKSFLIGATMVLLLSGMATAREWEEILPAVAAEKVATNPNAYILDVRTVAEYKFVGHPLVPDGKIKNIPFWKFEFDRATDQYIYYEGGVANENKFFDEEVYRRFNPATDTLIVVCKTGGRAGKAADDLEDPSEPAANRLEKLGFFQIYRMTGGFVTGWQLVGLPTSYGYEGIWKPSDFAGRSVR